MNTSTGTTRTRLTPCIDRWAGVRPSNVAAQDPRPAGAGLWSRLRAALRAHRAAMKAAAAEPPAGGPAAAAPPPPDARELSPWAPFSPRF